MNDVVEQLRHLGKLIETHASWVFVGPRFVFKLKKPVNFGFLDFSTLEKREAACQAEVLLNARLAPSVYLGVVPVRRDGERLWVDDEDAIAGLGAPHDPGGAIVDYAVKMHRLPDDQRADDLLARQSLEKADIERMAVLIADFHARCDNGPELERFGSPDAIAENVRENFEQTSGWISRYIDTETERSIEEQQLGFLRSEEQLFEERVAENMIRDGHGDLRLDHVYVSKGNVFVIDCIEFNDRFRYADTAADLAFLAMDLAHRGRRDLSEWLLARYVSQSGDYSLYRLIDFYEGYRAYVRGKVTALLDQQEGPSRPELAERARGYFLHALAAQNPPLKQPRLVCIGGLIASGKSTIAARVASWLCCAILDTDRIRKRLLRLPLHERSEQDAFAGAYDEKTSEQVYSTAFTHAEHILSTGRSVIVEASFRKKEMRKMAVDLAHRCSVPLLFVECQAPADIVKERLRQREQQENVSDARLDLYDSFARNFEPLEEMSPDVHRTIDTTLPRSEQDLRLAQFGLGPEETAVDA